jgi:hypothetical protein
MVKLIEKLKVNEVPRDEIQKVKSIKSLELERYGIDSEKYKRYGM